MKILDKIEEKLNEMNEGKFMGLSDEESEEAEKLQKLIDDFVDKRSKIQNQIMDELKAKKDFEGLKRENKKYSAIVKLDRIRNLRPKPAWEAINKLPKWIKTEFSNFQKTGKI